MTLFPQNNALWSILQGRYAQLFPGSRQLKVKFKKHVLFHNSNYQLSQAHLLIMDHPVSLITKTFFFRFDHLKIFFLQNPDKDGIFYIVLLKPNLLFLIVKLKLVIFFNVHVHSFEIMSWLGRIIRCHRSVM